MSGFQGYNTRNANNRRPPNPNFQERGRGRGRPSNRRGGARGNHHNSSEFIVMSPDPNPPAVRNSLLAPPRGTPVINNYQSPPPQSVSNPLVTGHNMPLNPGVIIRNPSQ